MSPSVSSGLRQAQFGRPRRADRHERDRGRPKSTGLWRRGDRSGKDWDPERHRNRLIVAYEAALAVAQEVTPEAVLQRIVDMAREVVPARYAVLGMTDEQGQITQFITSGITAEEWTQIGNPPEGRGLLGQLIRERTPLLIPDIAADPRSVGVPPGHPSVRTLLGVPILGRRVLGNLYLAEREDEQPFDADDLAALQILATHATAAIDRAQAYQRVEEQRDQLRKILDSMPAGIMIVAAPDGQIELANAAVCEMIFGPAAPPGALPRYGRDLLWLRADGIPVTYDERIGVRALRGEVTRDQQILLVGANSQHVPVLVQSAPLPGTSGVIERAVLVVQNLSRLREADQLKDDFLSLVSHEFRTPLTTIHGGAHLLANQDETLDEDTRRGLLDDIVAESDRLDQMLANMMTLTAVMAGRLEAHTEPLLVEPLARKTAAEVAARSPNHVFRIDVPPGLPPADGDPELLTQVLRNLYENAVKYSPAGGDVRTTASTDGDTVTIQVADSGIGIAADEVDRVFKRFYRASADPSVRGLGLGLYLSHHLVEAQGGHISASSPGPGMGSIISVTLPLARDWGDEEEAKTSAVNGGG